MNKKSKVKSQKSKGGFTLLELLVVIAIIGILFGLAAVSLSTAQKKGRDARRKGDLRSIQNGLEQYYSVCGSVYPTLDAGSPADHYTFINCSTNSLNIMPTVPADPLSIPYYCSGSCGHSSFKLCATLESELPANYCVSNQQ